MTGSTNKRPSTGSSIKKQLPLKKGKPRGIRRDRDCFTCRNRGVKCDLNRPVCTPCLEAKVKCEGYPARLIWSTPLEHHMVGQSRNKLSNINVDVNGNDPILSPNDPLYVGPGLTGVRRRSGSISSSVPSSSSSNSSTCSLVTTSSSTSTNNSTTNIIHPPATSNSNVSYGYTFNQNYQPTPIPSPSDIPLSPNWMTTNQHQQTIPSHNLSNQHSLNCNSSSHPSHLLSNSTHAISNPPRPRNLSQSSQSSHNLQQSSISNHRPILSRNSSSTNIKSDDETIFSETSPHLNKSLLPGIAFSFKKEYEPFTHFELPPDTDITPTDDDVDPMRVSNFLWGIKAILTAFNHAKRTNTSIKSQKGFEKSEILSTIWKFVSACLDHTNKDSIDAELNSLQLRANAIEELKTFINNGVIEAIFSILAFTYFDVCQGSFGNWHSHLQGARSLLDLHCQNKQHLLQAFTNTPGLQHAVTLLNWYDVTGVIANPNRSFIFESWHREAIDNKFFSLVGCPKNIFLMIPEICKTSTCSPEWRAVALNEVLLIDPNENSYVSSAGNAWRYACLIMALERTSFDNPTPSISGVNTYQSVYDIPIETLVGKVLERIAAIPFDTALSQHLAVIVYMTARNAVKEEHREVIRRYWNFWSSEKFPLYSDALWQCEQWWEDKPATSRSTSEISNY